MIRHVLFHVVSDWLQNEMDVLLVSHLSLVRLLQYNNNNRAEMESKAMWFEGKKSTLFLIQSMKPDERSQSSSVRRYCPTRSYPYAPSWPCSHGCITSIAWEFIYFDSIMKTMVPRAMFHSMTNKANRASRHFLSKTKEALLH